MLCVRKHTASNVTSHISPDANPTSCFAVETPTLQQPERCWSMTLTADNVDGYGVCSLRSLLCTQSCVPHWAGPKPLCAARAPAQRRAGHGWDLRTGAPPHVSVRVCQCKDVSPGVSAKSRPCVDKADPCLSWAQSLCHMPCSCACSGRGLAMLSGCATSGVDRCAPDRLLTPLKKSKHTVKKSGLQPLWANRRRPASTRYEWC